MPKPLSNSQLNIPLGSPEICVNSVSDRSRFGKPSIAAQSHVRPIALCFAGTGAEN